MSVIKLKSFFNKFFLLFVLFISCNAQGQTIRVNGKSVYSFKSNSWNYFTSNNRNLQISEVITLFKNGKFKPVNATVLNGGIADKYYWIHFNILNKDNSRDALFIDIQSPRLNEIELYEAFSTEIKSLGKLGDFSPFKQRTILNKNYIYSVNFQPNQSKDYFLLINQVGNTLILPIQVFTPRGFQEKVNQDYLVDGIIYGILICVSLFSLLFFINTKDTLYLYYSLYILTGILWLLSYFGIGYQYLWGNYPSVSALSAPLMASLNVLINIQICKILLQLKIVNATLHKMGIAWQYLLIGVGLFPLFFSLNRYGYNLNHSYLLILLTVILLSILFILVSVIIYSLKGSLSAKVYFVASSFKVASIINIVLLELGFVPGIYNLESILQIGILIETTLLTYAIANRYSLLKKENEKFGKVLMNTQLEIQEQTFQYISQEIHDNIGQVLTLAKINLSTIDVNLKENINEKINDTKELLRKAIQDLRDLSKSLSTETIGKIGIIQTIELELNILKKTGIIDTVLKLEGEQIEINPKIEIILFRIVQEILQNIMKHAKASCIQVTANYKKKNLHLSIIDDGAGFDHTKLRSGSGVANIQSRCKLIGAFLNIQSDLGKGTQINISLPIP